MRASRISVSAICPGYIGTEIKHHLSETRQGKKLLQMPPRKRFGKPDGLDALLVMLPIGQSHFVNWAVIAANDGFGA